MAAVSVAAAPRLRPFLFSFLTQGHLLLLVATFLRLPSIWCFRLYSVHPVALFFCPPSATQKPRRAIVIRLRSRGEGRVLHTGGDCLTRIIGEAPIAEKQQSRRTHVTIGRVT